MFLQQTSQANQHTDVVRVRPSCWPNFEVTAKATTIVRPCHSTVKRKHRYSLLLHAPACKLAVISPPSPPKQKSITKTQFNADQEEPNEVDVERNALLDLQNVRAEGHVVKSGRDLGEPCEDEESSEGEGSRVCRSVLEISGVVRACFRRPTDRPTQKHGGRAAPYVEASGQRAKRYKAAFVQDAVRSRTIYSEAYECGRGGLEHRIPYDHNQHFVRKKSANLQASMGTKAAVRDYTQTCLEERGVREASLQACNGSNGELYQLPQLLPLISMFSAPPALRALCATPCRWHK